MGNQELNCRYCKIPMRPGKAMAETFVSRGEPVTTADANRLRGRTIHAGGPGKLIEVMKCPFCGYSVTAGDQYRTVKRHPASFLRRGKRFAKGRTSNNK